MKLDVIPIPSINPDSVEYGDLIITRKGAFLIVPDYYGMYYMGINLEENATTDTYNSVQDLLKYELKGEGISRLIKSDELVLGVK